MNDKNIIDIAYFRFALIAPVIQGVFPDASKTAYYRRVTQNPLKLPDGREIMYNPKTLEKWDEYYRKNGMDALMPKTRSDKGGSRTLNNAAIEEIYRLKVERNLRTLKDRWLNGLNTKQIPSLGDFNRQLKEYINQHNTTIHSATGEKPIDRYMRDFSRIRKPENTSWLEECFMNRQTRRVNNDGTLSIFRTLLDAPMQFIGMKVQVRYLPDALDKSYIFYEGQHYPLRLTNKVENSKSKRNNGPSIDYSLSGRDSFV